MQMKQFELINRRVQNVMQSNQCSPRSSKYQSPTYASSPSKHPIKGSIGMQELRRTQLGYKMQSPRGRNQIRATEPGDILGGRERNICEKSDLLKNRIKNVLRRMKYKDKLVHLEHIIEEARAMSHRHGYFYVTSAMFMFRPESQIKLRMWIPNVQQQKCLHAIQNSKKGNVEKQFYTSLKIALRELFPTISLGEGLNYTSLLAHVRDLQQNLTKRLLKSPSGNLESVLGSPRENGIYKNHSNKILKVSRLLDFHEGISIIEEDTEQISMVEHDGQSFWRTENRTLTPLTKLNIKKNIKSEENKSLTHRHSVRGTPSNPPFQTTLSNLLKEDEGEFTLADSKLRPNTSRDKITQSIASELKRLLRD